MKKVKHLANLFLKQLKYTNNFQIFFSQFGTAFLKYSTNVSKNLYKNFWRRLLFRAFVAFMLANQQPKPSHNNWIGIKHRINRKFVNEVSTLICLSLSYCMS